jgi:hypothetical protein
MQFKLFLLITHIQDKSTHLPEWIGGYGVYDCGCENAKVIICLLVMNKK